MSKKVIIIGGGISGITTALTLQVLGYNTTIYAEHLVNDEAPDDPRFASLFPAASVIPHSVQTDNMDQLFPPSQQIFYFLLENRVKGIRLHKHYELFERKVVDPSYAKFLQNYARIDRKDKTLIPHYSKSINIDGWVFDCIVTEWPIYIQSLYKWYKKAAGNIVKKHLRPEDLSKIDADIIVNCSGIWSRELFGDTKPKRVVRGHLLHIKDAPLLKDSSGRIPSYNYTPGHTVYSDPEGHATDVYFYPRSNGWILGGSRQQGIVDKEGNWIGDANNETTLIGGMEIPSQIYELNREIINNTYDIDLYQFTDLKAKTGYRYIRSYETPGLRLEETKKFKKTIIHNYGHGGAGVTLSWGCALQVNTIMREKDPLTTLDNSDIDRLQTKLLKLL